MSWEQLIAARERSLVATSAARSDLLSSVNRLHSSRNAQDEAMSEFVIEFASKEDDGCCVSAVVVCTGLRSW